MTDVHYQLIVAFPDDSPSFVHGFEAGQLWQQMTDGMDPIETLAHTANQQVLERMAAAQGYALTCEPCAEDAGWLTITLHMTAKRYALPRSNPHGLTIVRRPHTEEP